MIGSEKRAPVTNRLTSVCTAQRTATSSSTRMVRTGTQRRRLQGGASPGLQRAVQGLFSAREWHVRSRAALENQLGPWFDLQSGDAAVRTEAQLRPAGLRWLRRPGP